ncbi:hypothetical protein [Streptomyces sp. NPDC049555]|uniref:hypothetical protein n=1 Tax=Streptomyces sp. NPDC049555 TaxID=3154930 RepID=UPI00343CC734
MATDADVFPRSGRPSAESAAQALALAEQAQEAVCSIKPSRWYEWTMSSLVAAVFFVNLLPEPFDLVALGAVYAAIVTVLWLQFRASGVRRRATPALKRGAAACAVLAMLSYLGALLLEDWAGMSWIWAPAGLLVGGVVHVLDRTSRTKGIPAQ